jgi:hypothetical protein
MPATVRFSQAVQIAGTPEPYTLWLDPAKDRTFQAALKDHRVMMVHQKGAGTTSDWGEVGYEKRHAGVLLVFPKSLKNLEGKRVVGIKYELLAAGEPEEPSGPAKVDKPAAKKPKDATPVEPEKVTEKEEETPAEPAKAAEKPAAMPGKPEATKAATKAIPPAPPPEPAKKTTTPPILTLLPFPEQEPPAPKAPPQGMPKTLRKKAEKPASEPKEKPPAESKVAPEQAQSSDVEKQLRDTREQVRKALDALSDDKPIAAYKILQKLAQSLEN